MKRLVTLIAALCSMSVVFLTCSYGGPFTGGSLECMAYCQKSQQCCEADPYCDPWDEYEMSDCLCECTNMYRVMTDEFIRGMDECMDLPCESEMEREQCMDTLLTICYSGMTPAVEAYCTRIGNCYGDSSYAECVQMYNRYMGCYNRKVHDAMLACSGVGTCDTLSEAFAVCMNEKTGIVECDPVDY